MKELIHNKYYQDARGLYDAKLFETEGLKFRPLDIKDGLMSVPGAKIALPDERVTEIDRAWRVSRHRRFK